MVSAETSQRRYSARARNALVAPVRGVFHPALKALVPFTLHTLFASIPWRSGPEPMSQGGTHNVCTARVFQHEALLVDIPSMERSVGHMPSLTLRYVWAVVCLVLVMTVLGGALHGDPVQAQATPEAAAGPPSADGSNAPATCRVGLALESVHNINLNNDTTDADFWIWSVCADDRFKPLSTMQFVNANSVRMSMEGEAVVDGLYWTYARVSGTFRHFWDLERFPFDRQVFQIVMEDTDNVASIFAYEADTSNPIPEEDPQMEDWRIMGADLTTGTRTYQSTFGDPSDREGSTDYSQLILTTTFERDDLMSFFKLTFVVYIAFLISLLSYFLNLRNPMMLTARMSIISGTLFSVAVNMRTATSALSTEEGMTLIDKIHIAALIAILIDAVTALVTQRLIENEYPVAKVTRFNQSVMIAVVLGFVAANAVLISLAAGG